MNYIDETLIPGEKVLYRTRLHWAVMIGPIVGTLLLVAAALAMLIAANNSTVPAGSVKLLGVAGIALLTIAAGTFGWGFWRRSSTEMAVTNKRVLVKVGMISRNTTEMMLSKIESVAVHQNVLGRMFNFGTIIVRGTGGTPEPFARIAHPLEFRRQVQQQLDEMQSHATTPAP